MMPTIILGKRATLAALLGLSLVLAVMGATPQGKSENKSGGPKTNSGSLPVPGTPTVTKAPKTSKAPKSTKTTPIPGNGNGSGGNHQSCIQSCNSYHKSQGEQCKGRTGQARASCQRAINQEHQRCVTACPK